MSVVLMHWRRTIRSGFLLAPERTSHRGQLTDKKYTCKDGGLFLEGTEQPTHTEHTDYSTATGNIG